MGQPRRLNSAMESPLGVTRPWTPPDPDTDPDATSRDDFFADSYRRLHIDYLPIDQDPRPHGAEEDTRCDTPTEGQHQQPHQHHQQHQQHQHHLRLKPKPVATTPAPIPVPSTPTHSPPHSPDCGAVNSYGLPRYPYTPDSSRMVRRSTEHTSSPLPWGACPSPSSSPVQNALSSCIAHFQNLLQTRQPDEDQMEYIVGQFEAMATYLSAPDAQSRDTEEHLFTELENSSDTTPAGKKTNQELNEEYIAEVGRYIQSVKGYVVDLKMRLDEVKMLNSIQSDVIQDLMSQVETVKVSLRSSPTMGGGMDAVEEDAPDDEHHQPFGSESTATLVNPSLPSSQILDMPIPGSKSNRHVVFDTSLPPPPRWRTITIIHKPQQRSFWSSFAEALDSFGNMIFES